MPRSMAARRSVAADSYEPTMDELEPRVEEIVLHGHRVSYRTAGQGPLVLLIHGIAGSSEQWDGVIPLLAEHFTIVAPDLLGHGRSAQATRRLLPRGVRGRRT
jgi:pimeloyl-ACP methyl ester carboxylesterase